MNDQITQGAIFFTLSMFILDKVWNIFNSKNKALVENTLAVTRLTIKMEYLEEKLDEIGEIKRDLDKLGSKVREMHD